MKSFPLPSWAGPRIDVTVRISGFFRDAFPSLINLLDQAVEMVASQDESPLDNMVVKHLREDLENRDGAPAERDSGGENSNRTASLYRIFGSKPGTYGAGILGVLDERNLGNSP